MEQKKQIKLFFFLRLVLPKEKYVSKACHGLFKSHDHTQKKSICLKNFISKRELDLEML